MSVLMEDFKNPEGLCNSLSVGGLRQALLALMAAGLVSGSKADSDYTQEPINDAQWIFMIVFGMMLMMVFGIGLILGCFLRGRSTARALTTLAVAEPESSSSTETETTTTITATTLRRRGLPCGSGDLQALVNEPLLAPLVADEIANPGIPRELFHHGVRHQVPHG